MEIIIAVFWIEICCVMGTRIFVCSTLENCCMWKRKDSLKLLRIEKPALFASMLYKVYRMWVIFQFQLCHLLGENMQAVTTNMNLLCYIAQTQQFMLLLVPKHNDRKLAIYFYYYQVIRFFNIVIKIIIIFSSCLTDWNVWFNGWAAEKLMRMTSTVSWFLFFRYMFGWQIVKHSFRKKILAMYLIRCVNKN
jgi:hypothetical protein